MNKRAIRMLDRRECAAKHALLMLGIDLFEEGDLLSDRIKREFEERERNAQLGNHREPVDQIP